MTLRAALIQLTSTDNPIANLAVTRTYVSRAAAEGAQLVLTPEVTNIVSESRAHQRTVLQPEETDPTLAGLREDAARSGIWLLIGSLGLQTAEPDGRFANRSLLIAPNGDIAARYDKIHMFDVQVSDLETYQESAGYRPGDAATLARTPLAAIGMSVCYDLRFPHLYRQLAQAGAEILTVPAAFSYLTGQAHWEVLLRARAIETGCFVLAPAQTGSHPAQVGRSRRTHGHSLAVAPWGEVLADAGVEPGVTFVDIDLSQVAKARGKVPSLTHDRPFRAPDVAHE